ncbi:MAG: T9SS type A sorting domain-containing protein [Bacteroidales bacterium]|nr:T9SS type A sorting domain-containing protein [Bacteroidales bacterium]
MKAITFTFLGMFCATFLFAQWEPIGISASDAGITSMFSYGETVMAGTDGDGIFKTEDSGQNWTDISGNLPNNSINDIRGGVGPQVIWVATQDGAYFTIDHSNYSNCSNGLTNTDVNYFWFGDGNSTFAEWAIGTNGGGVFVSAELEGPWNASSTGISGDGLVVNDISGYTDDEVNFVVAGTDGGVYFSFDTLVTWTANNTGLSGEQLKVQRVGCLGSMVLIATHNGFFYSLDFGNNWVPIFAEGKFNSLLFYPTGTGFNLFVIGEVGYYTPNLLDFYPIDLTGIPGEVTSIATNSTYVFIGTATPAKSGKSTGGIYRKPLDQLITGVEEQSVSGIKTVQLDQNVPNPFKSKTRISYSLHEDGYVILKVYDMFGREVSSLVNDFKAQGQYQVEFDASGLSEGLYFYILDAGKNNRITRKMMIAN